MDAGSVVEGAERRGVVTRYTVARIGGGPSRDCRLIYLVSDRGECWIVLSIQEDFPAVGEIIDAEAVGLPAAVAARGWGGLLRLPAYFP